MVFVAVGSVIGGFIRGVMQSGEKPTVTLIARTVIFILVVSAIAFFVFKKIK